MNRSNRYSSLEIGINALFTFLRQKKMINRGVFVSLITGILLTIQCVVSAGVTEYPDVNTGNKGKAMPLLPAVQIETGDNPDAAVIWLHGLGADGNDFAPIIPELRLPQELAIRFLFPHAPSIPVTINGGYVMPAWYDIVEMEIDRKVDTSQLLLSAEAIHALIDAQLEEGIDSRRILLAGFSQGGAVAYQVALSREDSLGGLLAMSSYFATEDTITLHAANEKLAIEIHHGNFDQVVPKMLGEKAYQSLKERGYTVTFRSYNMEHSVCLEQIQDISQWIQGRLK